MGRPCQTFAETTLRLEPSPERPSDHTGVPGSLREREQGDQIKRISTPESNSGEISESGINPESSELNSISSFGSRSEQISASRKPLFLDTTLCLKVSHLFCEMMKSKTPLGNCD